MFFSFHFRFVPSVPAFCLGQDHLLAPIRRLCRSSSGTCPLLLGDLSFATTASIIPYGQCARRCGAGPRLRTYRVVMTPRQHVESADSGATRTSDCGSPLRVSTSNSRMT